MVTELPIKSQRSLWNQELGYAKVVSIYIQSVVESGDPTLKITF